MNTQHSPSSSSSSKWWSADTVAIVTGGNKGIGYEMVKRLAEEGLAVVLTARDLQRGRSAVHSLAQLGLHVHFSLLDVSDPHSISSFISWFTNNFSALDILVNNAGISFNDSEGKENSVQHWETVIKTNYYGPKLLTEALLPHFRQSPSNTRILNITSRLGSLKKVKNGKVRAILEREEVKEEDIERVVRMFGESVKDGTWESEGWPEVWTDYAVSKMALNAYSRVLAKRCAGEISVKCFCPGYTRTNMTAGRGSHTPAQAAAVAVRLLLLPPPPNQPSASFYVGLAAQLHSKL